MRRSNRVERDEQGDEAADEWPDAFVLRGPDASQTEVAERVREEVIAAVRERRPPVFVLPHDVQLEVVPSPWWDSTPEPDDDTSLGVRVGP